MRAALYCRVSLDEQVERYGLDSQVRALHEYSASRGYEIVDVFRDEGYTGAKLDRPGLDAARSLIRSRAIDVLIAHAPDRLSRDVGQMSLLWDEARRAKVRIQFVTCSYEDTPEGTLMMQILGGFAQFERAKIAERTLRGRREKARRGLVVGGPVPYGYVLVDGRYVVEPTEADWVRQAYAWAVDGLTVREIAARLTAGGAKPRRSAHWRKSTVSKLLTAEVYTGKVWYNRRERQAGESWPRSWRPGREWIEVQVPALVTGEQAAAAKARLERNREVRSGRESDFRYELRGLLHCARCGKRYAGCPCKGVRYYRCCGRDRDYQPKCTSLLIRADCAEGAVWASVTNVFSRPGFLRSLVEDAVGASSAKVDAGSITAQIDELRKREARAARALLDADLTEHFTMFRSEAATARRTRQTLERELASLQRPTFDFDKLAASAQRALATVTPEERQRFLAEIVDRIVVDGKALEIRCWLPIAGLEPSTTSGHCEQSQPHRISFILNVHLEAA